MTIISQPRGRRIPLTTFITLGLCVAAVLVVVGYPVIWLVLGAFGLPSDFTFTGIIRAYSRSQNLLPLVNTLWLALGVSILSVLLGVPLAWITARTDVAFKRVIHACVALSYITPPYLTALAYIILAGPDAGYFNRALRMVLDVQTGPLNVFGLTGVIFVVSLHCFAYVYFMTAAALRSVDASMEEAAQMLGAKRWRQILRINLPLVAPAITGGALMAAVDSVSLFGPQAFLGTPGQVTFLPTRIYGIVGNYPPRWAEASALSLLLVAFTCIGLFLQRRYLEKRSYITIGGKGVRIKEMALGGWRWAVCAASFIILFFSIIAPLGVLVMAAFSKSWVAPFSLSGITLDNFRVALFEDQVAIRGIVNSFKLASGAALAAVIMGAAVVYLDLRTKLPGRKFLSYLSILPMGLPGTVMAIGVILAFIRPPIVLYGTIWILFIAYAARYLPIAARSIDATLRQFDPSLEEAARITGATWLESIRYVLLPMARPGLVVAFLLVFIPTFSELSATIMLYTGGTETIAVAIFRLNDLGRLEVVSALAVFMIAVILLTSVVVNWVTERNRSSVTAATTS